jgi:hypothetical protein
LVIEERVIVSGIVNKGIIRSSGKYHLGPYNDGSFKLIDISNIHCKKIPVKSVSKGQYCSIWIKSSTEKIKKEDLRKGMVLLDLKIKPIATRIFEADIWTIDGTRKTLKNKYQPVLNIKHIRQGCRIVEFKNKHTKSKNSSSNNLITHEYNKTLNNNFQSKNKKDNSINTNIINNFVPVNLIPNKNNNEIMISNTHPLKNLMDNHINYKIDNINFNSKVIFEFNNCDNNNKNIELKKGNGLDNLKESIKDQQKIGVSENNICIEKKEVIIDNNNLNIKKPNQKTNNMPKEYNSDNSINKLNGIDENKKTPYLTKNKLKKSSISKKEELEIKVKTDFNSDKNIIKLNELNSEYENLKVNDYEETCIISPNHNCIVVFEFMYNPEYITEDANILISDQLIKAHGIVKKLYI